MASHVTNTPTLTLDRDALRRACRDLGLKLDAWVKVERLRPARGAPDSVFVGGRYDGVDCFNPAHRVSVNPYQTVKAATTSLAHELIHALQCERIGSWPRFDSEYERQLREAGIRRGAPDFYERYRSIPFEAEAFSLQNEFSLILSDGSCKVLTR